MFLGDQLQDVVSQLVKTGNATSSLKGGKLQTGVSTLPDFTKDATDRNRTSPFAFTGNKFEFRMLGSRDSVAAPNIVLDTIVAEAFSDACDVLEQAEDFDVAVHDLIKQYLNDHQRIIFNGNGYSDEWVAEAERRGLPNLRSMVDAIPALESEKSVSMFEKFKVFTKPELASRVEIKYETYAKNTHIEAATMIDMASKSIIPAVIHWNRSLADTVIALTQAGVDAAVEKELLAESTGLLAETKAGLQKLIQITDEAEKKPEGRERAVFYHYDVTPVMAELRAPVDKLEMIVDKDMWPMPSYGDLMFSGT